MSMGCGGGADLLQQSGACAFASRLCGRRRHKGGKGGDGVAGYACERPLVGRRVGQYWSLVGSVVGGGGPSVGWLRRSGMMAGSQVAQVAKVITAVGRRGYVCGRAEG